jgi:prepilin-type N-terminal cleavage/methylation domain-containing protein
MRRLHPTHAREAMTLIELLIVMMIIATLASLVLSAVFTVRESQMKSFTESLVTKLSVAVEQEWKKSVDQIREEPVPTWALTMASNDPRIAKVIYLKARLKQEFPVTFFEAIYPNANYTPSQSGAYQTPGGYGDMQPKATYSKALAPLVGTVIPNNVNQQIPIPDNFLDQTGAKVPTGFEASALLYLWLSQGRRGTAGFNPDEHIEATAIRTATVNGVTFKYFVDSWGNPVRGWAFPYGNDELNAAPYLQNTFTQNQQSPDVQDPDQTFASYGKAYPWSSKFALMIHQTVPLRNLVPVIGSAGKDAAWGMDVLKGYFDMTMDTSTAAATASYYDNIYSYRLRRSGQRGD